MSSLPQPRPDYQNRPFQIAVFSIYMAITIIGSILIGLFDVQISLELIAMRDSSPFLARYAEFFDRSLFDGDGWGGQDISYLLIIAALLAYALSFIPHFRTKLKPIRKYAGYILATALVMTAVNRGFKALFARVRPNDALADPSLYSPMWTFGHYVFLKALKTGSFTSGHTNVAMFLVAFAFLLIGTRKKWAIALGFSLSIGYGVLMAVGRAVEGDHFLSDGFWSILLGILIAGWIYFAVLKIPEHERGDLPEYTRAEEFRWGVLFFICIASGIAALISLRYIFINFLWYQPIILACSPVVGYFSAKRANKILSSN